MLFIFYIDNISYFVCQFIFKIIHREILLRILKKIPVTISFHFDI